MSLTFRKNELQAKLFVTIVFNLYRMLPSDTESLVAVLLRQSSWNFPFTYGTQILARQLHAIDEVNN